MLHSFVLLPLGVVQLLRRFSTLALAGTCMAHVSHSNLGSLRCLICPFFVLRMQDITDTLAWLVLECEITWTHAAGCSHQR